jgi:hypothetical protein
LVTFRSEAGAELFDLPDAPRPDPDIDAPVRFLPEFDNILLSHADPSRIMSAEHRAKLFTVNGIIRAAVLVDGRTSGKWQIARTGSAATLTVEPFRRLSKKDKAAIEKEGTALLDFTEQTADGREVRILPPAD